MIEQNTVMRLAEAALADSACYLVDVVIGADNAIVVEIDHDEAVSIDDCVALSQYIEQHLDRDAEDYELEVTSAGLDRPFKIVRQYRKHIGSEIELKPREGALRTGMLKDADETGVTLTVAKKVKPEGARRKTTVYEDETYRYDEIAYAKSKIRFK
jgi:hypothetical protein